MRRFALHFGKVLSVALLGGLASAAMARYAPGFGADERLLDPALAESSRQRLLAQRAAEDDLAHFYVNHLAGWLRGDWGESRLLGRPVRTLVAERAGPTLIAVGAGLALAWAAALTAALSAARFPRWRLEGAASALGIGLQSLPAAVTALLLFACGARGPLLAGFALALVVYPRIVQLLAALVSGARDAPHVVSARARGMPPWRVVFQYVLLPESPRIFALAGVSASIALGAAIPVETVLDVAGLGQLAWQAALGRDLPLLVALSVLLTLAVTAVNAAAEAAGAEPLR